jgi:hypothetical protein
MDLLVLITLVRTGKSIRVTPVDENEPHKVNLGNDTLNMGVVAAVASPMIDIVPVTFANDGK